MGQILFELNEAADRETVIVYRQGLRDDVTILKFLDVF